MFDTVISGRGMDVKYIDSFIPRFVEKSNASGDDMLIFFPHLVD